MVDFTDSQVAQTWTAPFQGTTRNFRRYQKAFYAKDGDYLVYYVQFNPPGGTIDFHLYLDLVVQGASWEFWAAYEAWLEVDGHERIALSRNSKETDVSVPDDRVRFHFTQDGYNGLYNGRRVRFIVQHGNNRADVPVFDMWVDQINP